MSETPSHNFLKAVAESPTPSSKRSRRFLYCVLGGVVVLILVSVAVLPFAYERTYQNRIYPGVYIGKEYVGGMTRAQALAVLEKKNAALLDDGIHFAVSSATGDPVSFSVIPFAYLADRSEIPVSTSAPDGSVVFAAVDTQKTLAQSYAIGREGSFIERMRSVLQIRLQSIHVPAAVTVDPGEFQAALQYNLAEYEAPVKEASLLFTDGEEKPTVTHEIKGVSFSYEDAIAAAQQQLIRLDVTTVVPIERIETLPSITYEEALPLLDEYDRVIQKAPVEIVYTDPNTKLQQKWNLDSEQSRAWLQFEKIDGQVVYGIAKPLYTRFIEPIATQINIPPQDAKFFIDETTKLVTEFKPSKDGLQVAQEQMFSALNERMHAITTRELTASTMPLLVERAEPAVKTADVNTLGINELLGVGVSKFVHSSGDRIKNIKNASNKLNGVLIAPGEEFSLVKRLRPITLGNGYVPEFVIKGDKIEKDVGGGLCQIGTTAFRMAMNSGLPITERYNHSLVVSYYNDLTNGNPGTDATIFDPSRDLKFMNDTGSSLLLTTEVDVPTVTLRYYLWGTSDGRKGHYTPPVVKKWISVGAPKEILTTDQPPGKKKCQVAYPGAITTFTYTIERPDGTVDTKVFDSSYRSLPRICFIGATVEEVAAGKLHANEPQGISPESSLSSPQPKSEWPTFVEVQ